MERGSSSRRSWADEVEEADAAAGFSSSAGAASPRSPGLNPDAAPFIPARSPAGSDHWGGRLIFSDSEASLDGSEQLSPHGSGKGKAVVDPCVHCRRRVRRHRAPAVPAAGSFMAAARRVPPMVQDPPRIASVVVHPAREHAMPDADGFFRVQSRRRWHRHDPPRAARPVPENLVGRCFNCLATDHVWAVCRNEARCLRCHHEGHRARDCSLSHQAEAKRRRSPARTRGMRRAAPRRRTSLPWRPAAVEEDTTSSRSTSTGHSPSVPRCCVPSSPSEPVASQISGVGVEERTTDIVVLPRTAELNQAEEALKLALVAMVGGTRPPVSPAMVRAYLQDHFGVTEVSVRRHAPQDFIVRFVQRDDLELVLGTPATSGPLTLTWHRWSRTCTASPGSFRYKIIVGMSNVPTHARSARNAQSILGNSCAKVEVAPPEAVDEEDEREFFVAAWCVHPRLVPEEKIIAVPEPEVHDLEGCMCLRPEEIIHAELPTLRYLVTLRIVEFQDWNTPPSSPEVEGAWGRRGDNDGSGDSNHNGYHPGVDDFRSGSRRAPTTRRFANAGDGAGGGPALGPGYGPTFRSRSTVAIGSVACPVSAAPVLLPLVLQPRAGFPGDATVEVVGCHAAVNTDEVDLFPPTRSPMLVADSGRLMDPMSMEAAIQVAVPMIAHVPSPSPTAFPVDMDPGTSVIASGGIRGFIGSMLVEDPSCFAGDAGQRSKDALDGLEFLLAPAHLGLVPPRVEVLDVDVELMHRMPAQMSDSMPIMHWPAFEDNAVVGPEDLCQVQHGATTPAGAHIVAAMDNAVAGTEDPNPGSQGTDADHLAVVPQVDAVAAFIDSIVTPLPPPLISSPPKLRTTKTRAAIEAEYSLVPRRSARLAAKSQFRANKPEAQARKVMLRKLGEPVETELPDQVSFEEFQQTFKSPLCEAREKAMRELFPGRHGMHVAAECTA